MVRVIISAIFIIVLLDTSAQTFSLITDPIIGEETTFHNNSAIDIHLLEDRTQLFCEEDSSGKLIYSLTGEGCGDNSNACQPANFNVGDKWTYEHYINFSTVTFQDIEIVDEIEWMGEQAFVVEPGLIDGNHYQQGFIFCNCEKRMNCIKL